ncbi:hypothetical protein FHS23_000619 [Prauserella isguenensis]|uniref:Excreted virulence factor EspC (Type VII ESX diderm) n=1 Tax=Prauserella isguenensis TaxID=1470180 RepID=A0A839RX45_9PSEU|nr:hypothetical protein [Prauserella isguenensis]MBB3049624.1 hypothetical protein [Prauserella isguenensis]
MFTESGHATTSGSVRFASIHPIGERSEVSGYDVDPDTLVSTGDTFVSLADGAGEAVAEFSGSAAVHAEDNDGFAAAGKAGSLATLWEYHVDDLNKRTAVAGELLRDAADGYGRMEDAVLDTLPELHSEA